MRILVTGSRDWDDWLTVAHALFSSVGYDPVTVVHGACPTGVDKIADDVATHLIRFLEVASVAVERHPADWSRGRRAGPERNAHMVSLGADICLAFIGDCTSPRCDRTDKHPSHGASGCADLAEQAGIPVRRIYA